MILDQIKGLIADLARPFSIISTSGATAIAIVKLAGSEATDLNAAAIYAGACLGGVAILYWGKGVENARVAVANAEVEKERAKASPPPAEALKQPTPPEDDGALPPDQRVKL